MAEQYLIYDETLTNIGNTIRSKYDDYTTKYYPKVMPSAIRGIPSGGDWRSLVERNLYCINDRSGLIQSWPSYAFESCETVDNLTLNGSSFSMSNLTTWFPNLKRFSAKNLSSVGRVFSVYATIEYLNFGGVLSVSSAAFSHCYNLKSIILSVCSYIGGSAFYNCSNLQMVRLMSDSLVSVDGSLAFPPPSINDNYQIYVPTSLLETYQNAGGAWFYLSSRLVGD